MLSAGPPETLRRLSTRRLARHGRADRDRRTPSAPARGPRPSARAGGRRRRRARRHGEALAAITVPLPAGADPTAIAAASRRPGEAWFSFEQADRDRFALAGLGCVAAIDERGPDRFAAAARAGGRWPSAPPATTRTARAAAARSPSAGSRSPPTAAARRTGRGTSRRRCTCPRPPWRAAATRSADARRARPPRRRARRDRPRASRPGRPSSTSARSRCSTRIPPGGSRVSAMPPEHYEAAVARAVERIRAGALDKIVLAREVQVHARRRMRSTARATAAS